MLSDTLHPQYLIDSISLQSMCKSNHKKTASGAAGVEEVVQVCAQLGGFLVGVNTGQGAPGGGAAGRGA